MAFDRPRLIIGHRGAAGLVPENTLPGFDRAVALGVDAVELDVHLVQGRLCVIHDDTLDRTTNGSGPLSAQSFETLRALDAGNGASIPLLEEVFEAVGPSIGVNVELKGVGTALPLAELLSGHYSDRPLLVSSFDHRLLAEFKQAAPEFAVAPLFDRWRGDPLDSARRFAGGYLNLSRKLITPARCRAAAQAGIRLLVYTVNELAEARRLFDMGVAGVFTDFPDRIRRDALNGRAPSPDDISHP